MDLRHYRGYTPAGEHRIWYQCLATRVNPQGETAHCTYSRRSDRHFEAMREGKWHTCKFAVVVGPLDEMLGANSDAPSIGIWDKIVRFATESNMCLELNHLT
jgi:hypothetical protein